MQGYENALEVKKAYNAAVTELEGVRKLQSEWDQKGIPEKKYWVIKANVPEQTKKSRQGLPVKKQPEPSMLFIEGSGCNCRLA